MTIDSCNDCHSPSKVFDSKKSFLLDGGFASQLEDNGWTSDRDPLWSSKLLVTNPDAVNKVHRQFIEAGADIITTNSYQASIDGFRASLGLNKDDALAAITNSVTLARLAITQVDGLKSVHNTPHHLKKQPLVAGSIGPYGASLCDGSEYTGAYGQSVSKAFLKNWHRPRLMALLAGGADCLALETFPCLKEALAVAELLQALDTQRPPVWVSFTLRAGDGSSKTLISDGKAFEDAYQALRPFGFIVAIGANCVHPDSLIPILKPDQGNIENSYGSKPLVVYPNSGELWDHTNCSWFGAKDCVPLASLIPSWHQGGARIIGGCCRVLHTDIAEMRKALDACVEQSTHKNGANHCN